MASTKSLLLIPLLILLLFSKFLSTSTTDHGGEAPNSLTETFHRNIFHTAAHPIAKNNGESSLKENMNNALVKKRTRPLPLPLPIGRSRGHNRNCTSTTKNQTRSHNRNCTSIANQNRGTPFGIGSIILLLGLVL